MHLDVQLTQQTHCSVGVLRYSTEDVDAVVCVEDSDIYSVSNDGVVGQEDKHQTCLWDSVAAPLENFCSQTRSSICISDATCVRNLDFLNVEVCVVLCCVV